MLRWHRQVIAGALLGVPASVQAQSQCNQPGAPLCPAPPPQVVTEAQKQAATAAVLADEEALLARINAAGKKCGEAAGMARAAGREDIASSIIVACQVSGGAG